MQNNNKNNILNHRVKKVGWFSALVLLSSAAFAQQDLPPLPPLPPLPGMELPAAVPEAPAKTPAKPSAPVNTAPVAKVAPDVSPPALPENPSGNAVADAFPPSDMPPADTDFALPDFGLFDPSALPSGKDAPLPPPQVASPVVPAEAPKPAEQPKAVAKDDSKKTPTAEAAKEGIAVAQDAFPFPEIPTLPSLPALPGFEDNKPAQKADAEKPAAPAPAPAVETPKLAEKEKPKQPDVAALEPPKLPDEKPLPTDLSNILPSWATDTTLPSLKPMPQDRDKPKPETSVAENKSKPEAKPVTEDKKLADASKEKDSGKSLADLIDEEISKGDTYEGDKGQAGTVDTNEPSDLADLLGDEGKRVVWPENFKTQQLPPEIYQKQYSNANRHLPHAMYQKEIEAHLFGAVGANDPDAVRALLRTGVPLNIRNAMGEDLVMQAVKSGAAGTLQLLLALGAPPVTQDRYGATPLHRAVFMGRQDMVVILLRAGANSYTADMNGVTPMSIAMSRQDQPMMQTMGYYQGAASSHNSVAQYQPY